MDESEWATFGKDLLRRIYQPFSQPSYVLYFLGSIILGAAGIWLALAESALPQIPESQNWNNSRVFGSIVSYSTALGALSCFRIVVVEKYRSLRALLVLLALIIVFFAIIAVLIQISGSSHGYPYLVISLVLAVVTCWMANWEADKFSSEPSDSPLGGNVQDSPAGTTEGFKL